ncbi:MAG: uncharacterized protein A8A55_3261, partial [Amphiamblys sp. WSBS2006]
YIADLIDMRVYGDRNFGYTWILNIIDSFSRFVMPVPLKGKNGDETEAALRGVFLRFWAPTILHTDNGGEFRNGKVRELCRFFRTRMVHGRARYPQSQGQIERANQTLKRKLCAVCIGKEDPYLWVSELLFVSGMYNRWKHSTVGEAPMDVFFGGKQDRSVLLDVLDDGRDDETAEDARFY